MIEILKMGESTRHDSSYRVDRPNGYPYYLLLLVQSEAIFLAGGEWQNVKKGCAVIFAPNQMHRYESREKTAEAFYQDSWLHFSASDGTIESRFPFGRPFALHNTDDCDFLFHLLFKEYVGNSLHKNAVMTNLASALIHKLEDESDTKTYPDSYYRLASIREEIFRTPQREWRAESAARTVNMSAGYFHAIYKKYFGSTFIADVVESRIQAACQMISSSDKSIEEIAFLCGYKHTEHFIRQFKSSIRSTPLQYRKNSRLPRGVETLRSE